MTETEFNARSNVWLMGDQFIQAYYYAAGCVGRKFQMKPDVKEHALKNWHAMWRDEFNKKLESGEWTTASTWQEILMSIASGLSGCDCVTFALVTPLPPPLSVHQDLLLKFPSQYIAVQFVRNLYISVQYQEQNIGTIEDLHYLQLEGPQLVAAIKRIAANPIEAGDFESFLHLPPPPARS